MNMVAPNSRWTLRQSGWMGITGSGRDQYMYHYLEIEDPTPGVVACYAREGVSFLPSLLAWVYECPLPSCKVTLQNPGQEDAIKYPYFLTAEEHSPECVVKGQAYLRMVRRWERCEKLARDVGQRQRLSGSVGGVGLEAMLGVMGEDWVRQQHPGRQAVSLALQPLVERARQGY